MATDGMTEAARQAVTPDVAEEGPRSWDEQMRTALEREPRAQHFLVSRDILVEALKRFDYYRDIARLVGE